MTRDGLTGAKAKRYAGSRVRRRYVGCAALLLATACSGAVQTETHERLQHYLSLSLEELMEQQVSISTQSDQPLSTAPSVVTVITAEDMRATGAANLVEALQAVPGLYVKRNRFGFRPLLQFRGSNDKQTLLMINGATISDLMWRAGIFWKGLPTSVIDRVEIIRGPGSAMYGADASAGVINVITKTAAGVAHPEVGLRTGSFDTQSAWVQHGGEWNGFDLAATLDLSRTDGHDPLIESDAQTLSDLAFGSDASLAPAQAAFGYRNTDLRFSIAKDHWRLLADYTRHDDLQIGLTGASVLDPVTEGSDSRLDLALLYDNPRLDDDWGLSGEVRFRHLDYSSGDGFQERPPGFTDDTGVYPEGVINRMRSAERRLSAELVGRYRGFEGHTLQIGAGYRWQDLYRVEQWVNRGVDGDGMPLPPGGPLVDISDTPYAFAPEKSRNIAYAFVQDVWNIAEEWQLTAGARYDDYSDFGDTLNPRVALVWQTGDRLTTKLLYGEAFRAPYYQELFSVTSFSLPNPDLGPERSATWDLSLSYAFSEDLRLGMSLYRFRQHDVIGLHPVAGSQELQYQNAGSHSIDGVELEAWWQPLPDLRLSGNYSYNDPDDSPLREVGSPRHQTYLRADWHFRPTWQWNVQANWVGKRDRRPGDPRPPLDDYLLADTTLRFIGFRDWDLAVSVRNLFDEDARDFISVSVANDLPLEGRSVFLEARYDFDRWLNR